MLMIQSMNICLKYSSCYNCPIEICDTRFMLPFDLAYFIKKSSLIDYCDTNERCETCAASDQDKNCMFGVAWNDKFLKICRRI